MQILDEKKEITDEMVEVWVDNCIIETRADLGLKARPIDDSKRLAYMRIYIATLINSPEASAPWMRREIEACRNSSKP